MSFFSKINASKAVETAKNVERNLTYRWGGGFEAMGHVKHPADTRTAQQIKDNLEIYAESIPEVKKFISELKSMPLEHQALASDVIERANRHEMLMTSINLKAKKDGSSAFERLIEDIAAASKTNPEALGFLKTVMNNTDSLASKFTLYALSGGILKNNKLAGNFANSKALIPEIAEQTLSGGYLGTFEKENNFLNFIKILLNPASKPKNIELVADAQKVVGPLENIKPINLDTFIQTEANAERIMDNITTIKQMDGLFKGKQNLLDTTDYLLNNVNMY